MSYSFFKIASSQPDLQDVVSYLSKSIIKIEEIKDILSQSTPLQKTGETYLNVNDSVEKITQKYLPELINDYCSLSLDYRNTEIIKVEKNKNGDIKYTAKELLLKSVSKIIEEINLLDKKINESNSYDFLVKNRLVSQLGVLDSALQLESDIHQEKTLLNNQFNYSNFKKEQSDNKLGSHLTLLQNPVKLNQNINQDILTNIEENISEYSSNDKKSFSLIDILMIVIFFTMVCTLCFIMYSATSKKQQSNHLIMNVQNVISATKNIYGYQETANYADINMNTLVESRSISKDLSSINPFGEIKIEPSSYSGIKNNNFKITLNNIPSDVCVNFVNSTMSNKVIVNEHTINKNDISTVAVACAINNANTIELIND